MLSEAEWRILRAIHDIDRHISPVPESLILLAFGDAGGLPLSTLRDITRRGLLRRLDGLPVPAGRYAMPDGRVAVVDRAELDSDTGFELDVLNLTARVGPDGVCYDLTAAGLDALTADSASSKSLPADDARLAHQEDPQPPALTGTERLVLCAMARFSPFFLATARQVAEEIDLTQRLSERTVTPAIRRLVELGLAERPEGDRQGARLTTLGRQSASQIAD